MLLRVRYLRLVRSLVGAALLVAPIAGVGRAAPAVVPAELRDVTGAPIDVTRLATRERLVFVTLKASWCPVCRAQLQRLGRLLPRFRACGATFVVLAPGTSAALAAVARETSFPYPFVAEGAVGIATAAGLVMAPDQLVPAFFVVNAAREIVWQQRGRADGAFGDRELLRYLGCEAPSEPDLRAGINATARAATPAA